MKFDPQKIKDLKQLAADVEDPDMLPDLVRIFTETTPKQFAEIEGHIAQKNTEGLGDVFHSLKSTAATLGFEALREICLKHEQEAKAGKVISASDFNTFKTEALECMTLLKGIAAKNFEV